MEYFRNYKLENLINVDIQDPNINEVSSTLFAPAEPVNKQSWDT